MQQGKIQKVLVGVYECHSRGQKEGHSPYKIEVTLELQILTFFGTGSLGPIYWHPVKGFKKYRTYNIYISKIYQNSPESTSDLKIFWRRTAVRPSLNKGISEIGQNNMYFLIIA